MKLSEDLVSVLELVSLGLNNKEIGVKLSYSPSTVKRRIKELFKLYKVDNRVKLAQEYLMERL